MDLDHPPVVRVWVEPERRLPPHQWPMDVPAVAQLEREGLDLPRGVTFLVGENGSGKSTIVEAVAMAYGLSPEGGSAQGAHSTRPSESGLAEALSLRRGLGASRWGFFLRAETMHGWYTFFESTGRDLPPGRGRGPGFHEMSHGESFLEVLRTRFDSPGFYCLDEPEAALSFSSTLGLISTLHRIAEDGGQVLCATHSPVLAAMPGATLLEVGDWGYWRTTWRSSSWSSTGTPTWTRPAGTSGTSSTDADRRSALSRSGAAAPETSRPCRVGAARAAPCPRWGRRSRRRRAAAGRRPRAPRRRGSRAPRRRRPGSRT